REFSLCFPNWDRTRLQLKCRWQQTVDFIEAEQIGKAVEITLPRAGAGSRGQLGFKAHGPVWLTQCFVVCDQAYASQSGLRIEFREDLATVECGEAHVAEAYVMQDAGGQISVKIQNGATPFTLSLQPNGTRVGSGSIGVAGRVVTGSTENALTY